MTRPDPRLLAAARLVENLAAKMPHARAVLRAQIDAIDGWTASSDAPKVQHTAELTPVESAANQRLALATHLADLEAHATAIATIAANACNDADHIIGHRIEAPRCNSEGRDGAGEWGRACNDIASRGPLCDACSQREYRWRRQHGLPARHNGVWSVA